MGFVGKLFLVTLLIGIGAVIYPLVFRRELQLPEVRDQWFGKTKLKSKLLFIKFYKIHTNR